MIKIFFYDSEGDNHSVEAYGLFLIFFQFSLPKRVARYLSTFKFHVRVAASPL
jgi:hypothetical protein